NERAASGDHDQLAPVVLKIIKQGFYRGRFRKRARQRARRKRLYRCGHPATNRLEIRRHVQHWFGIPPRPPKIVRRRLLDIVLTTTALALLTGCPYAVIVNRHLPNTFPPRA